MSLDVLLKCPRTSFRDVLGVNVTERVWIFPLQKGGVGEGGGGENHADSLKPSFTINQVAT